jgi:hypothetical protein
MAFNTLIVDTVVLPNPSSMDYGMKDLDSDNSYTSETGSLVRDVIGYDNVTLSLSWDRLSIANVSKILKACTRKEKISVTYFDLYDAAFKTQDFYSTDRSMNTKKIRSTSDGYFSLSFDIIAVNMSEVV